MAELKATMSHAEFVRWQEYYDVCPFDDLHRYHRPAALIAHSVSGNSIDQLLEWLQPQGDVEAEDSEYSEADLRTFKALGLLKPPKRN